MSKSEKEKNLALLNEAINGGFLEEALELSYIVLEDLNLTTSDWLLCLKAYTVIQNSGTSDLSTQLYFANYLKHTFGMLMYVPIEKTSSVMDVCKYFIEQEVSTLDEKIKSLEDEQIGM